MIKVFNGAWRGLGKKEKGLGLILDFEFREVLALFKGARLAVFMAVALHSDKDGIAYPGYDLLEKETGYNRSSVADALNDLCCLEIDGSRVLYRFRIRDDKGKFVGGNHYLIFPTPEEIQSRENPTLEKPNVGKTPPEVNPLRESEEKPPSSPGGEQGGGNGNGAKPKSEYVLSMERLEKVFCDARGCSLPDYSTPKAIRQSEKRWRTPLRELLEKCDGDQARAARIVQLSVAKMMDPKKPLTFDAPDQIVKVAGSLLIDYKNGNIQVSEVELTPEEWARQQLAGMKNDITDYVR